jgi:1,4-dihydroxy-6-naphthoate synthase
MLRLGISTCPNDIFAFFGILSGAISLPGVDLQIDLLDIQKLNEGLFEGHLDIAKGSFFSACRLTGSHTVLPVGAALGFGVGPIVVTTDPSKVEWESSRVMCPGLGTTASFLLQHFHPEVPYLCHGLFSEIPDAVLNGTVDLGVLIHEGRFTFQNVGLKLVEDLGAMWEESYSLPLPLGGLFAKREIDQTTTTSFVTAVRQSISYAYQHKEEALLMMQTYAQEFSPDVIWQHVDLYVNRETERFSSEGRLAIEHMFNVARAGGLIPAGSPGLSIRQD